MSKDQVTLNFKLPIADNYARGCRKSRAKVLMAKIKTCKAGQRNVAKDWKALQSSICILNVLQHVLSKA